MSTGEVGKVGVPVPHLGEMRHLFADIPLTSMNTSMTINATAPILLALYVAVAKEQGYDVEWPIWRGYYMGPNVSDEAYQQWADRLRELNDTESFKELREGRGLFPMSKFGDDFHQYVKQQVADFQQLSKEVGLTR